MPVVKQGVEQHRCLVVHQLNITGFVEGLKMLLVDADAVEPQAAEFTGGWIEFDTNEDYENACRWVEDGSIKELIEL